MLIIRRRRLRTHGRRSSVGGRPATRRRSRRPAGRSRRPSRPWDAVRDVARSREDTPRSCSRDRRAAHASDPDRLAPPGDLRRLSSGHLCPALSPVWHRSGTNARRKRPLPRVSAGQGPISMVGDTGFEPVTSSVSRKRATAAPIAREGWTSRWRRDLNPCKRLCRPLPRLSATPPVWGLRTPSERMTGLEPATSTLARLRSTN